MMTGQIRNLYRLQKKDVPKACAVLTNAYRDDPVWREVLAESKTDAKRGVFEVPVRYCLRYGEVYATSENLGGMIAWVPGDLAVNPQRSELVWIERGRSTCLQTGTRVKPLEDDRIENMKGSPFIYLPVIGVASDFPGQGFGGKLLCALNAESEQARIPIYLETETECNVNWYEEFGCETAKQINLPMINLPMWEMARKPKT